MSSSVIFASFIFIAVFVPLRHVQLASTKCPKHEALLHNFKPRYYLDRGENIEVWAELVPEPWEDNRLIGSLADTKFLAFNLTSWQGSSALRGNGVIYRNATATIKQISGPNSRSNPTGDVLFRIETFSEDPSCVMLKAETNITVGCPPNRHILIRGKPETCAAGFANYSFIIPSDQWKNIIFPENKRSDKTVEYNFIKLGCPFMLHKNQPFKPIIDLYDGETFVKEVDVNFIIWEQNDRTGYQYSTTMKQAGCVREAQTWEKMLSSVQALSVEAAWSKENYQSCFQSSEYPLQSVDLEQMYEIMNTSGYTHVVWKDTGVFVFSLKVIDLQFSFCNLTVEFGVHVNNVQTTMEEIPTFVVLGSSCLTIIILMLSGYYIAAFCTD